MSFLRCVVRRATWGGGRLYNANMERYAVEVCGLRASILQTSDTCRTTTGKQFFRVSSVVVRCLKSPKCKGSGLLGVSVLDRIR